MKEIYQKKKDKTNLLQKGKKKFKIQKIKFKKNL